jgi:hypothetical protein
VIERDAVLPLVVQACPSFAAVAEEASPDDGEERLPYLDAAAFVRHLGELWLTGDVDELPAAFAAIERLVVEGDPDVSELAVVGYLESMQSDTITGLGIDPQEAFVPLLGPASRVWWDRLLRFWAGDPTALQVDDT